MNRLFILRTKHANDTVLMPCANLYRDYERILKEALKQSPYAVFIANKILALFTADKVFAKIGAVDVY